MTTLVACGEPAIGRGVPSEVAIHILLYQPKSLHMGARAEQQQQQQQSNGAQRHVSELGREVALDPNCGIDLEKSLNSAMSYPAVWSIGKLVTSIKEGRLGKESNSGSNEPWRMHRCPGVQANCNGRARATWGSESTDWLSAFWVVPLAILASTPSAPFGAGGPLPSSTPILYTSTALMHAERMVAVVG